MRQHSDQKIVYTALVGNFAIAVMKFIVAGLSGSSAMLAEGFHSADAIDLIESRIRAAVPEVKRIHIEAEAVKMRFSKEKFGYTCSSGTLRASNCL